MATRYQRQADAPTVRMGLVNAASVDPLAEVVEKVERFSRAAREGAAEQKAMADVAAGKLPDMGLAFTDAQAAYNQAAARAYEAKTSLGIRAEASKLATQFDGRQPGHVQAFEETFDAYSRSLLGSVPAAIRPRIELEVQARRMEAVSQIRDRANRFEFDRNVSDINAGIEADLTDAATAARDGREDIVLATIARTDERIDSLVALGVIGPEAAAQKKREARGGIEAEAIFGDFSRGAINLSPEAIIRGEGIAAGLDTAARDRLASKVSGLISRRQADAAHARAAFDAQVKENTRQVKALAERRRLGVRGTPQDEALEAAVFEGRVSVDPEAFDALRSAAAGAHLSTLVTSSPVAAAESILSSLEAQGAADVASAKLLEDARDLVGKHRAGLRGDDPVQYLSGIGALSDPDEPGPPPPLSFDTPDALVATLADRKRRIAAASEQYGEPLPSMTRTEVSALRRRLDMMADLDTRVAMLGAIAAVEGPQADRTIAKLAESGAEQYAIAGALAAKGLAEPARDVLAAGFIDSETKTALLKDGTTSTVLADFEAEAGPMYRHDPENAALHLRAAQDLYASRAFRQGLPYDANEFRRAVRDAVGGTQTIETGGVFGYGGATSVVPATSGVDWSAKVSGLTGRDIERMGGTNLDARLTPDGVAKLIRETGSFRYTPEGLRVVVQLSGGEAELAMPDGTNPFLLRP